MSNPLRLLFYRYYALFSSGRRDALSPYRGSSIDVSAASPVGALGRWNCSPSSKRRTANADRVAVREDRTRTLNERDVEAYLSSQ